MPNRFPLAARFLAGTMQEQPDHILEQTLERLVSGAREAWPTIVFDPTDFAAAIGRHFAHSGMPVSIERLSAINPADLLLALVGGREELRALGELDKTAGDSVDSVLERSCLDGLIEEYRRR